MIGYEHFLAINFPSSTLKVLKNGSNHSTNAVYEITDSIDCQDSEGSKVADKGHAAGFPRCNRVISFIKGLDMEEIMISPNKLFTTKRHFLLGQRIACINYDIKMELPDTS